MPAQHESIFESLSPLACKIYLLMQDLSQGLSITASLDTLAARAGVSTRAAQGALTELRRAAVVHRLPRLPHTPSCYTFAAPRRANPDRKYTSGLKSPLHPPTSHENAPKPLSIHDGSFPPSAPDRKPASGQEPPLSLAAEIRRFALEALPTDPHRLMFLLEALPRDQAKAIADALPQSSRDALIAHASAILAQTAPPDTAA